MKYHRQWIIEICNFPHNASNKRNSEEATLETGIQHKKSDFSHLGLDVNVGIGKQLED